MKCDSGDDKGEESTGADDQAEEMTFAFLRSDSSRTQTLLPLWVCALPTKESTQAFAPVSLHIKTDGAAPLPHNATSTDPNLLNPLLHVALTPLFFMRLRDHPREAFMAFPLLI